MTGLGQILDMHNLLFRTNMSDNKKMSKSGCLPYFMLLYTYKYFHLFECTQSKIIAKFSPEGKIP